MMAGAWIQSKVEKLSLGPLASKGRE